MNNEFIGTKFKVGNRVICKMPILMGMDGVVLSINPNKNNTGKTYYDVMIDGTERNIVESMLVENYLEEIEFPDIFLESSHLPTYSDDYMEGVRNHMIEAGIDPNINDPMDYIYFQEMAGSLPEIKVDPKGKHILIVAVGSDETRGLPHFHVFRSLEDKKKWRNGACLIFNQNRYFDHDGNNETLTRDELRILDIVLQEKPEKNRLGKNNWQFLLNCWNSSMPDWELDINTPIMHYDYKTITRYKEHVKPKKK
jgi:hypothetical protein